MPVKYIDVTAVSDLFVPATRAFGDIAIIGKGRAGTPASDPVAFTEPASAATTYPVVRTVKDGVLNTTTTVTSATAAFVALDVGRPVTGTGIPAGATIATVTNGTTITLSSAATATATGVTLTFGLKTGENDVTDLAAAIALAFRQSPAPSRIWGVQVSAANSDWDAALAKVARLSVQIVVLANTPLNTANLAVVGKLAAHVDDVSTTGGDGKERIGVAMLDPSLAATAAAALNTSASGVKSERMFLIAHTSDEDAGAAAAGVIAGHPPQVSMLLKPIKIKMDRLFSDTDIDTFHDAAINWVTSPVLIPGQALFLGEGLTADPSHNKKYLDIVRTVDAVNFMVKAELISAIGDYRVNRPGLRGIVTLIQAVLSPQVPDVIDDFSVHIPLLALLDKDPATLSGPEQQQIQTAQASRTVDLAVTVTYAGAIHRLHIDLVFK